MPIRTIEQLTKKHNLKLGDTVSRCKDGEDILGPILGFEMTHNNRSGNKPVVIVESGKVAAGDVCWVPTLEQIEIGDEAMPVEVQRLAM